MAAALAVPALQWEAFISDAFRWEKGEHVALCGPTGQGKSFLACALVTNVEWQVFICTKPKDSTVQALTREGYKIVRQWPPPPNLMRKGMPHKFILWPKFRKVEDQAGQAGIVRQCLNSVFADSVWTVILDEQEYISDDLHCRDLVRLIYKQGRSMHVSLVAGNQRPRWVPRETWTQATHLFIFSTGDREDLKALSGLGAANSDAIRRTVPHLPPFHVLYVNTRTGSLAITKAPRNRKAPK